MACFVGVDVGLWSRETMLAYTAGLIDGEGHVGISKRAPRGRNKSTTYTATCDIAMCDTQGILAIKKFFDFDHLNLIHARTRSERHRRCYTLCLRNHRAHDVIAAVRPFLLVKREQADVMAAFREHESTRRQHRTRVMSTLVFQGGPNAGSSYRVYGMDEDFLRKSEEFYQSVRSLNHRRYE
jgi:hypothetical protein